MWRPVQGLSLDASPEMPHAEKNFSQHVRDSSIEPSLKKSRPDYSSSWQRRDTAVYKEHETKSQKLSHSTSSEEIYHQSNKCEGGRGGVEVKYDSQSLRYHSGQGDANEKVYNKISQQPFVFPRREKPEYKSDVAFSGTSTSFIGPQSQPLPKKKPVTSTTKAKPPSFKIVTVALGKLANQSKGQDGMDYELRQFYKEINELEVESDDQTKKVATADVEVKEDISPATKTSNHHHGQVPSPQPFIAFPSTSSSLVSLNSGQPRPQLERPPLPLNNQFPCHGQAPCPPTNPSFVKYAIPPPGFEGHRPPAFIVPYGPPPPRFNYPITFTRPSNTLPPPPSLNLNFNPGNTHPPWHGSPVPPERCFASQGTPYNQPLLQGAGERTWQDLPHNDICRPKDGPFGERTLPPPGGNESHEQYLGRFRNNSNRKMVLLRGVPGSGKSTLARTLLQQSPDGIVLSTDDYFCQENGYTYDVKLLGDAHSWNQNRARRALGDGRSPVVIDNTNIQGWEMKPYVQMAVDRGYDIEFLEPETWWKQDAHELEKRTTHRVPREKISQMLERYEHAMTVPVVMNSVEPCRIRPPPESRPRTYNTKEKRHRNRYRKNGRKITTKKHNLSAQEDKGLENFAEEDTENDYNVAEYIINADGMGKVHVKIIYSGDQLATYWPHCWSLSTAALFRIVSSLVALMDGLKNPMMPKSEIPQLTQRKCLHYSSPRSLVIGDMLCKETKKILQGWSKGLHDPTQDIINVGLELYCNLISFFGGQTWHLYGMTCFKLQNVNYPKNQLTLRVCEIQDEKSNQKYSECKRFNDHYLETEISKCECDQIMDRTKLHVETKYTTPRPHKRHRKIYKLAPTFQHPRILSATQTSTWKNICASVDGDNGMRKIVTEVWNNGLSRRDTSFRAKEASAHNLALVTSKSLDGLENPRVTRSYSGFLLGTQSCAGLCLPEQFARQLVEIFGCPGKQLDAFEPKDFIVPLGYDLAKRIYLKWKKSLETKYKPLPAK
ncbi:uncharacterized protein LOC142742194 isoform X2 [Rhinoderma darwinii]|uniref:uncharacterized protein LOC142742194 isoform X2 n=1 Tax=Rhinoderma darwinii TaxID=43563 RepID=UPI003F671440